MQENTHTHTHVSKLVGICFSPNYNGALQLTEAVSYTHSRCKPIEVAKKDNEQRQMMLANSKVVHYAHFLKLRPSFLVFLQIKNLDNLRCERIKNQTFT